MSWFPPAAEGGGAGGAGFRFSVRGLLHGLRPALWDLLSGMLVPQTELVVGGETCSKRLSPLAGTSCPAAPPHASAPLPLGTEWSWAAAFRPGLRLPAPPPGLPLSAPWRSEAPRAGAPPLPPPAAELRVDLHARASPRGRCPSWALCPAAGTWVRRAALGCVCALRHGCFCCRLRGSFSGVPRPPPCRDPPSAGSVNIGSSADCTVIQAKDGEEGCAHTFRFGNVKRGVGKGLKS